MYTTGCRVSNMSKKIALHREQLTHVMRISHASRLSQRSGYDSVFIVIFFNFDSVQTFFTTNSDRYEYETHGHKVYTFQLFQFLNGLYLHKYTHSVKRNFERPFQILPPVCNVTSWHRCSNTVKQIQNDFNKHD